MAARGLTGWHPSVRKPLGTLDVSSSGPRIAFTTTRRPVAPAFFSWTLAVEGVHSPGRRWVFRRPLAEGAEWEPPNFRGRYAVTAWWELTDVFGFTRRVPDLRWTSVLTVVPSPVPFSPPTPPATRTGPWRPRRVNRRAGDPFDVRAYHPGDDLRRLHWPLYAHSGVPFVRTAEPSPPPSGHEFVVLDTEAEGEEDLDARLGAIVTWLGRLDAEATPWTLAIPAQGSLWRSESPWQAALASLHPAASGRPDVERWPEKVTLVTGAAGAQASLAERLRPLRRVTVVSVPPEPLRAPPVRPWWRRA